MRERMDMSSEIIMCRCDGKLGLRDIRGPSRAFWGRGIRHFFVRDIGKVGCKIAGSGMRYTHGTGHLLNFQFGKRENAK